MVENSFSIVPMRKSHVYLSTRLSTLGGIRIRISVVSFPTDLAEQDRRLFGRA